MSPRRLDAAALALLAATALGALLTVGLPLPHPVWAAWVVAALSVAKGALVALCFMGLAHAPPLWRRLVLGWLVGVWLAMGLAGWLGGRVAAGAGTQEKPQTPPVAIACDETRFSPCAGTTMLWHEWEQHCMDLTVNLTEYLGTMVKTKVASGLYESPSDVVREALRLLDEKDRLRMAKLTAASTTLGPDGEPIGRPHRGSKA